MKKVILILVCLVFMFGCGSDFYKSISTKDPSLDKPCVMWYKIVEKRPPNTIVCEDAFGDKFEYAACDGEYLMVHEGMWFVVRVSGPK